MNKLHDELRKINLNHGKTANVLDLGALKKFNVPASVLSTLLAKFSASSGSVL